MATRWDYRWYGTHLIAFYNDLNSNPFVEFVHDVTTCDKDCENYPTGWCKVPYTGDRPYIVPIKAKSATYKSLEEYKERY